MKAYVLTTGVVFLLIIVAHIARVFAEGAHLLKQPAFAFTSILALALGIWAWRLFRHISPRHEKKA
jgi:hypothetical protein